MEEGFDGSVWPCLDIEDQFFKFWRGDFFEDVSDVVISVDDKGFKFGEDDVEI